MCSRLLQNVPMFRGRDESFIHAVLLKLKYELFQEGDVIVRESAPGDRMFFIDHGEVLEECESYQRELCDGDYFGGGLDRIQTRISLWTVSELDPWSNLFGSMNGLSCHC